MVIADNFEHQINPRCRTRTTGDLARLGEKLLCNIYIGKLFLKARNVGPMSGGFSVVEQSGTCEQISALFHRIDLHAQAGLNPQP